MPVPFPPTSPTCLQNTIPAYVYVQHNDDSDIQAWWQTQNAFAQGYLDSINSIDLANYTSQAITGTLLDFLAAGIYGIKRPVLPSGQNTYVGPFDTYPLNGLAFSDSTIVGSSNFYATSDDIFKRVITWAVYKGDGKVFSIPWLKRRVMRFLTGANGTAPIIDQTYPVGVHIDASGSATITLTGVDPTISSIFQAAVSSQAVKLPFQFAWTVVIT